MLAYDFPVLGAFLTMLWFFLWVLWLFLLFRTIGDILRSEDLHGASKLAWLVAVIVFPYLGVFTYVLLRGDSMALHDAERRARIDAVLRGYGHASLGGSAGELTQLAELRSSGVIDEVEFQQQKARLLA